MLLAIDIGNTSITLGVCNGKRIVYTVQVDANLNIISLRKKVIGEFKNIKRNFSVIDGVIICSVVPKLLKEVKDFTIKIFCQRALIVGKDVFVPIKNCYLDPKQVGQDRLVCAYAAMQLYGKPAIIIDLGTAITLDVVSNKNNYEGGIIIPGIRLSAESLYKKTALLPRIDIHKPCALIGKDTEGSILSGIFYGYGAMISGLILKVERLIKGKPKVIVTGGYASIMKRYINRKVDIIDPFLALRGLLLIWDNRKAKYKTKSLLPNS